MHLMSIPELITEAEEFLINWIMTADRMWLLGNIERLLKEDYRLEVEFKCNVPSSDSTIVACHGLFFHLSPKNTLKPKSGFSDYFLTGIEMPIFGTESQRTFDFTYMRDDICDLILLRRV